jgi:hypothetical protein
MRGEKIRNQLRTVNFFIVTGGVNSRGSVGGRTRRTCPPRTWRPWPLGQGRKQRRYTVKKFDEVVRHLNLVTQDQFSLVSKKDSGIHEDNCNKNNEVFQQTFTNVELLRYKHIHNVELFR